MAYSQLRANIRNAMVPMTVAEATTFAASFDDAESRGYAEEFLRELEAELPVLPILTMESDMPTFLELRNLLMEQHGWDRRVATMATRLYKGVDTPVDLAATQMGDYRTTLLSEGEYRIICRYR